MDYFNELTKLLENGKETEAILMMKDNGKTFNKYQEFNGNTIMTFAIKKNLQLFANTLLNDKLLINMPDAYGTSPLDLCMNRNNDSLASQLIKSKCEINNKNKNGVLPVFLALEKGMFDVVKQIIISLQDCNVTNTNGNNLLFECINRAQGNKNRDYISLAEELINIDINLNYKNNVATTDSYGENALSLALKSNAIDIARYIIKNGSALNIEDENNTRPLTLCIEKGYEKFGINIIEKGIDVSYFANGNTFLTSAIKYQMHTIANMLVDKGATLDIPDSNGVLPLGLAIERGFEKLTDKIYKKCGDNKLASNTEYPLTLAIKTNNVTIAKNIIDLDKAQAINVYNKQGDSPFSLALKNKMDDLCIYMINNGLDLNVLSDNQETHLTLAIKNTRMGVAKSLLEKSSEIKANRLGQTPQEICRQLNYPQFLNYIENRLGISKKVNTERVKKEFIEPADNFNHQPIVEQETEKEKQAKALRDKIKRML